MELMRIVDIFKLDKPGKDVRVNGWVRTRRDSKGFSFLEINDGSTLANLQVIAPDTLPSYEQEIMKITTGSSITVEGNIKESLGKEQRFELQAAKVEIL
jgi:asparaginyl-tRNA synthetase